MGAALSRITFQFFQLKVRLSPPPQFFALRPLLLPTAAALKTNYLQLYFPFPAKWLTWKWFRVLKQRIILPPLHKSASLLSRLQKLVGKQKLEKQQSPKKN